MIGSAAELYCVAVVQSFYNPEPQHRSGSLTLCAADSFHGMNPGSQEFCTFSTELNNKEFIFLAMPTELAMFTN